jgi:hypothetical protein
LNSIQDTISDIISTAKLNYEGRQFLENLLEESRNAKVENKNFALSICHALIENSLEKKAFAPDSIMHRFSMALMDYIKNT